LPRRSSIAAPEAVGAIGVVGPRERVIGRGRDKKLGTAVIEARARHLPRPRRNALARDLKI